MYNERRKGKSLAKTRSFPSVNLHLRPQSSYDVLGWRLSIMITR